MKLIPTFLLLALILSPLRAEEKTLILDPVDSEVTFHLGSTLHEVEGTLYVTKGTIHFDTEGGPASGMILFDAKRTETGNEKRDRKMHSVVLESALFPRIEITPEQVQGALPAEGFGELRIEGDVAIHGGHHSVTLVAKAKRTDQGVEATFSIEIPFVKWGMKDPSVFVFRTDKEVAVQGRVKGHFES